MLVSRHNLFTDILEVVEEDNILMHTVPTTVSPPPLEDVDDTYVAVNDSAVTLAMYQLKQELAEAKQAHERLQEQLDAAHAINAELSNRLMGLEEREERISISIERLKILLNSFWDDFSIEMESAKLSFELPENFITLVKPIKDITDNMLAAVIHEPADEVRQAKEDLREVVKQSWEKFQTAIHQVTAKSKNFAKTVEQMHNFIKIVNELSQIYAGLVRSVKTEPVEVVNSQPGNGKKKKSGANSQKFFQNKKARTEKQPKRSNHEGRQKSRNP